MLCYHSIWKHMRKVTTRCIEKRAVIELTNHLERHIENIVKQSEIELKRLNYLRKKQGVYNKKRIDRDCIVNVIKNINQDQYSLLPKKAGGTKKREKEKNRQLQEVNFLTEVT